MNIINTIPREKIPVGYLVTFTDDPIPDGWLPCEGQILSQADYPILFDIIGTSYNRQYVMDLKRRWFEFWKPKTKIVVENMPGLFRLPDLRGLVANNDNTQSS